MWKDEHKKTRRVHECACYFTDYFCSQVLFNCLYCASLCEQAFSFSGKIDAVALTAWVLNVFVWRACEKATHASALLYGKKKLCIHTHTHKALNSEPTFYFPCFVLSFRLSRSMKHVLHRFVFVILTTTLWQTKYS